MSDRVHVESVDALRRLRVAMIEFAESIGVALDESDAEVQRTDAWLKRDQPGYWKHQVALRTELYTRAKSELNRKKLQSSALNNRPSCVDEVKALARAERALEEARQKQAEVRRWTPLFDQECFGYFAAVQKLRTTAQADLPRALAHLDAMIAAIEAYAPTPQWQGSTAAAPDELEPGGMARGASTSPDSRFEKLRRRSPSAAQRAEILGVALSAPAGTPPERFPEGAEAHRRTGSELIDRSVCAALLGSHRAPPKPDEYLILENGAEECSRLFLLREPAAHDGDSGWFLGGLVGGSAYRSPPGHAAIRVRELLVTRPELESILAFPTGWLIVIDGDALESVVDADNAVRWSRGSLQDLQPDLSEPRCDPAAEIDRNPDAASETRTG